MLLRRLEHSLRNLFDYFFRTLLEATPELMTGIAAAAEALVTGEAV